MSALSIGQRASPNGAERPPLHFRPQPIFWLGVLAVAGIKFVLHLYASNHYGYHHDELLFLAESKRLDWGFVDAAPGAAVYAWICRHLFGESLMAIRFLSTLAGTAKVVLTGAIAARLGGGPAAQATACLAVLIAPGFLQMDSVLGMNSFEPLSWMGAVYVLIVILQTGDQKLWLWIGVLLGLGLQNKHSTAFFAAAVAVGVLLTPLRRSLAHPWIWVGAASAFLIFLPNLLWQAQHDFPTLELLRNVKEAHKDLALPPGAFIVGQIRMLHPLNAPLWLGGLAWLLLARAGLPYRALGIAYLALLGIFIGLEAKVYYLLAVYPMLMAAGAVAIEGWLRRPAALRLAVAFMALFGIPVALLELPLLPVEHNLALRSRLGIRQAHPLGLTPLFFAQFGWEEMTAQVARAYHALPREQRARTAIFANLYVGAAAIDFFGRRHGLPQPISANQQYFLWGPRGYTGESIIVIDDGRAREHLEPVCGQLQVLGRFDHPYAPTWANREFFLCRNLKPDLAQLWPRLKWYGY